MYQDFIVLDVETNGVDPARDDIIEFAAVRLNDQGEVVATLDLLIAPTKPLTPTVISITNITEAMLEGAPTFDEVREQIVEFIGKSPIIGHSVSIDVDFLNGHGCGLDNPILDTFELAQTILPSQEAYSLEYLSYHYGFPNKPSHRAMADVLATVDLTRFLISLVHSWPESVRQRVHALIPEDLWSWQWSFAESITWPSASSDLGGHNLQTANTLNELKAAREYLPEILKARKGHNSFIEFHAPVDPLALNLAYAIAARPSVLVISPKQLKDIDWTALSKELDVPIVVQTGDRLRYRENSLEESAAMPELVTSVLARLMIKIILWDELWGRDYNQLYLSSDELRLWEQRFNDPEQAAPAKAAHDVLIITHTQHLLNLDVSDEVEVVIPSPLMVENQTLRSQIRTFSGYYLNWLISSRRDFIHTMIKSADTKLSDHLFKILNQVSTLFADFETSMVALYKSNPPGNLLDKEIELSEEHITDELKSLLHEIVANLTEYIEGLHEAKLDHVEDHINDTHKLIDYFTALQLCQPAYRYILYADDNRFFLDLVPERPDFSQLFSRLTSARGFTALSPALTFVRTFDYFAAHWPEFEGVVLEDKANLVELLAVEDLRSDKTSDYLIDLLSHRPGKHLILLSSGLEAHQQFEKYFDPTLTETSQSGSCELLGRYKGLAPLAQKRYDSYLLFSSYSCLDKIKKDISVLDDIFIFKLPADRSGGIKYGSLMGATEESKLQGVARQTLRFKEVLHDLSRSGRPIIVADPWLGTSWGRKVVRSLRGFNVVPVDQKEVI